MDFLEKVFNWMLVIGLIFMVGRIITLVFKLLDFPFTTFFMDYNPLPIIILFIGVIGTHVMKDNLRPFYSIDDLGRIKGIGPARIKDIKAEGLACIGG